MICERSAALAGPAGRAHVPRLEIAQFSRRVPERCLHAALSLVRHEQAVAGDDAEIEIGQRRGTVLVLNGQREPEPQLRDVDRERIDVDAAQVAVDDFELELVERTWRRLRR